MTWTGSMTLELVFRWEGVKMISYDILGLVNPLVVMRLIRRWFYFHVLPWMASYSTCLLFFHLNMVGLEKTVMGVLILIDLFR